MKKIFSILIIITFYFSCSGDKSDFKAESTPNSGESEQSILPESGDTNEPKITFVELGSVKCIPCKKMQPVMKAIEEKYGDQIKVIFYDVWTDLGRPYAQVYNIRLIPTQVFLDQEGAELLRHEGFFPEPEIEKFLQNQGLKPIKQVKHD